MYADVSCYFLFADEHSQFKFLCVTTPQSFPHAHKVVIFSSSFNVILGPFLSFCFANRFPCSSASISTAWLDTEWKVIFMVLPR